MPMEKKSMVFALANGYVEDRKQKQIRSHSARPSAVQGGHHQYSPTERRPRSPVATSHEELAETVRQRDERRESSAASPSTRRRSTASRASSLNRMRTPPSASTHQRIQRSKSSASARRRTTSSSASPSKMRTPSSASTNHRGQRSESNASTRRSSASSSKRMTTPPPRRARPRQRDTSSSMSPSDKITTPPPRSTSRTYSAGTPSLSPIDMRNLRFGSVDETIESPSQTLSPWRQELRHHEMMSLELEMRRRTSATQERSTPTPDRISAQPLQHGKVSPERVPKRPSTNSTSNAQAQTQRLQGAVLNTSPGHPTRTSTRSPTPLSPLQTSPALPLYQSSGSPTELNQRQSRPRTTTSPDSTPDFAVPAKPRPKASGSSKQQLHVDISTKTSPKSR